MCASISSPCWLKHTHTHTQTHTDTQTHTHRHTQTHTHTDLNCLSLLSWSGPSAVLQSRTLTLVMSGQSVPLPPAVNSFTRGHLIPDVLSSSQRLSSLLPALWPRGDLGLPLPHQYFMGLSLSQGEKRRVGADSGAAYRSLSRAILFDPRKTL